jgi:hypothetical protein
MLELTSLLDIVKRLTAALRLVKLAEDVIPKLISDGRTTEDNAAVVLRQIPALRADIDQQIKNAVKAMETIQDRVEALVQFLLLHRAALTAEQSAELDQQLHALKS